MSELLRLEGVSVTFGGVAALSDVSISVGEGEFVGLIGPNGAGKTTLINAVTRMCSVSAGELAIGARNLLHVAPHQVAGLGLARTFQNLALCPSMTAIDNVMLGGLRVHPVYSLNDWLGLPSGWKREARLRADAVQAMATVGVLGYADARIDTLSQGVRRKVELARVLCARPQCLLLDEPASGLSSEESEELVSLLHSLRASHKLAMLVVEHHMDVVMALSDRIVVLDGGRVIASGVPSEVVQSPVVLAAYLGGVAV